MEVMFSSPMMIAMFIVGMFILLLFSSGIIIAVVQIARGKFFVDYDKLAKEAWLERENTKKLLSEKKS
jgi:hypothetical protein